MLKLDLSNKKTNLIVSLACLGLALVVAVISAVQFISFRNYETEFVIRKDVVDEVVKFHEYSKHLKGTAGDSEIYVINGTENTVALVKAEKADSFKTEVSSSAKICAVTENVAQTAAAKATLDRDDFTMLSSVEDAVAGVKAGTYDLAVLRHADAKAAVKADNTLKIAKATLEKVPSLLVLGGTHPNEPSGQLTATLILENAKVERGILYVVTELNKSAFTHSQPQEATSWYYSFDVNGTQRKFKYGSRASNTVDQWPTPDVYTHSSGQQLSSSEVRNMNRAYPGSETGTFTEQIAWAITNFVNINNVTMVIDLHEASPEYAVINAVVYHNDSSQLLCTAIDICADDNIADISKQESPVNFHGLTHRELGDYTGAYVFLFETSNASQGKFRGKFVPELITYEGYTDKFYEAAVAKDETRPLTERIIYGRPVAIRERVARHTASVSAIIDGYNCYKVSRSSFTRTKMENVPESVYLGELKVSGLPLYDDLIRKGVEGYLLPSQR